MTIEEKVCRQEGIIVGLEIAISKVNRTSFQEDTEGVLAVLRTLLETEQTAYRTMKVVNKYDPISRASWRNSQRFFRRSIRLKKQKPALAHDDQRASHLAVSLAEFMRPGRTRKTTLP